MDEPNEETEEYQDQNLEIKDTDLPIQQENNDSENKTKSDNPNESSASPNTPIIKEEGQTHIVAPQPRLLTKEEKERINKYKKFKKVDGAAYERVNKFLRKHTYITAREWAIARLCADFTTRSGSEMTFIGENLPDLVPFMTDTYTPQAVNQARSSFKKKVKKSGLLFFTEHYVVSSLPMNWTTFFLNQVKLPDFFWKSKVHQLISTMK